MTAGWKGPTFIADYTCHKDWTAGLRVEGAQPSACLLSLPIGGPRLPLAFSLDVPFFNWIHTISLLLGGSNFLSPTLLWASWHPVMVK